jgi:hypothetical protein
MHLRERIGPVFFLFDFLQKVFRFLRVVPESGRLRNGFFFGYFGELTIDVKDASLAFLCAPQGTLSGQW